MNRPILLAVLGLSIAGNAALGFLAMRRSAATSTGDFSPGAANSATATRPGASASSAKSTAALTHPIAAARTDDDFKSVLQSLRDAGLPEEVIRQVGYALVAQEVDRRRRAIFDFSAIPYWRRTSPSPDQQRAMRELEKSRREMIAALGLPPSAFETAAQKRQFGDLPADKLTALQRIQQDYSEMQQDLWMPPREGTAMTPEQRNAQMKLLREEQQRDIAALLSPTELQEYELRSSDTANRLRNQLRSVEVSEQEYRTLFAAQKAYDESRGPDGQRSLEQLEKDVARWDALQSTTRGALGDDRYKQYLLGSQLAGRNAEAFFAERPSITVDQIQAIARMNTSVMADLSRETNAPGLTPEERRNRAAAVAQRYQAALTQLVGPEVAKDMQARNIVSVPRNLGSGRIAIPAVGLPGGN
jgi:hypothetical protein